MKKDALYLTISSLFFVISGYLLNVALGRILSPQQYGIYGVVISVETIISFLLIGGIPQSVSKYISENRNQSESILSAGLKLQVILALAIFLIYFLLSPLLSIFFHDTSLSHYFRISSFILLSISLFYILLGYNNGLHNFKKQAIIDSAYSIAKVLLVLLLILPFGLTGVFYGLIGAPLVASLVGFQVPKDPHSFSYKKLLVFSLPILGFTLFSSLQQSVDLYFLKSLLHTNDATGYYTANQNIARILFFGTSSFSSILFPSISKIVKEGETVKVRTFIERAIRYTLILLIPGALIMSATSSELLKLIYTEKYIAGSSALSILVIGMGFITAFSIFSNILNGAGKIVPPLLISLSSIAITGTLCFVFVPLWDLNGAALSTLIGGVISFVTILVIITREFRLTLNISTYIKIICSSLFIYVAALYFKVPAILVPGQYILLIVVYLSLLYVLRGINRDDIIFLKSFVPTKIVNKFKKS